MAFYCPSCHGPLIPQPIADGGEYYCGTCEFVAPHTGLVNGLPDESVVWEAYDRIPDDLVLWADGEELAAEHFTDRTYDWWRGALGHPKAHPGCCRSCGCATSCMLNMFYEAVATSVIRELLRQELIVGDFRDGSESDARPADMPDVQEGV